MNTLKSLIFLSVISLFLWSCEKNVTQHSTEAITTSVEQRSDFSCFENVPIANVPTCIEGILSTLVTIPAYPDCFFNASVPYVHCADAFTGLSTFTLGEPEIHQHDCFDFNDDIEAAAQAGTLEDLTSTVLSQVLEALTVELVTTSSAFDNGQTGYTIEYLVGACIQTCYVIEFSKDSPFPTILPVTNECAYDCCKVNSRLVFDNDGNYTIEVTQMIASNEECNYEGVVCPEKTLYSTSCMGGCSTYF